MSKRKIEFDLSLATPLRTKFKKGSGRRHNYVLLYDKDGNYVHKIKSNYTLSRYNSAWGMVNCYVYNNRVWLEKIKNFNRRRIVSYPISKSSYYYNMRKKAILTEKM